MDRAPCRDKPKSRYFGNVKNRFGAKLPTGVSQPPEFAKRPWEKQPEASLMHENSASGQCRHQPIVCRPLNHIPHIRNPKLRQYYLQGTSWDLCNAVVSTDHVGVLSSDSSSTRCLSSDMAFGLSLKATAVFSAEERKTRDSFLHTAAQSSTTLIPREQPVVPKGESTSTNLGSSRSDLDLDSGSKKGTETEGDQSSSPEAEYDKLLDVEAVSMPDGQLCLLALPPECCQEDRPEALPYLKVFCRYITDNKGVVFGILLVTANKIFFDPCKTHPLVKEHGCEEYLLSCSVDNLASVSFFSDISNIHFNTSQQRKKGKQIIQKMKIDKSGTKSLQNHEGQVHPTLVPVAPPDLPALEISQTEKVLREEESRSRDTAKVKQEMDNSPLELLSDSSVGDLGEVVHSSTGTFCCGSQEAASKVKLDLLHFMETPKSSSKNSAAGSVFQSSSAGGPGGLMFVRLRLQPSSGKKKVVGRLRFGSMKTSSKSDAWLVLSQESADKLYVYLKHCRPDLCIFEDGADEGVVDAGEEEFVLIEDKDQEDKKEDEDESFQRHCRSVDDWEVVLMEDSDEKSPVIVDRDPEGLANIVENSQILEASHVRELCKELPARTVGHVWQLAFSTSRHGASLKSLYRKANATDSPMLIVIKDALDEIFGAFLSHPLKPSEAFYGTGETFLFMLHPRFKCFKWTGENSFFIKGDLDSFAIGGGSGHFGLWVDENLHLGHSSPCYTFNNCCLSETDDFRVIEMEVWTFS